MTSVYHVQLSNGALYEVTTDRHHSSHSDHAFRSHLVEIIGQSMNVEAVSEDVLHFDHKGSPQNKAVRLVMFHDPRSLNA